VSVRRISDERDLLVRTMRDGGATLDEIAAEFGISRERVRQLLARMGVPERSPNRVDPIALIRLLREDETIDSWRGWSRKSGRGIATLVIMTEALSMTEEVAEIFRARRTARSTRRREDVKQQLVADVQALARELARSPRSREFRERYGRHPQFQRFYGTWNKLLVGAGLDPVPVGYPGWLAA
jgi:predicted ArsR family transcriptional regulator